jgi:hypothetical protein
VDFHYRTSFLAARPTASYLEQTVAALKSG